MCNRVLDLGEEGGIKEGFLEDVTPELTCEP